jgi:cyclopropane fatty-acyl-phospholipid synthase-like methyltransferase
MTMTIYGNEDPAEIDIFTNPINETMFYRYLLALHWCRDKDVLDAACGCGYGSHILRTFAKSVIGVDVDGKTIEAASKQYPHVKFLWHDILLERDIGKYDVVVSIETFEHIPRHLIGNYLGNLKSWCKEGGTIFITTPQRQDSVWTYRKNESHLYEYSLEEFYDIITRNISGDYLFLGLQEVRMGLKGQLVSLMTPLVREGHIMVAVIENVGH